MNLVPLHMRALPESVYLHYPLCRHTCSYCDFNVYRAHDRSDDFDSSYVKGVERDLASFQRASEGLELRPKTLYFGGGTPSLLEISSLEKLKSLLLKNSESLTEWTLEANPETLSLAKVEALKNLGVTRLSVGVQTFDPLQLKRLERLATQSHLEASLGWVAETFPQFSADLMIGIPNQTIKSLEADLERLLVFEPPHISIYMLTLVPDHRWFERSGMKPHLVEESQATLFYERVSEVLESAGYHHYEVSNFARPGFESRHNRNYWNIRSSYLGLGPGAHGYLLSSNGKRIRYEMIRDPQGWLESETGLGWTEELSPEQELLEEFYMKLRTRMPLRIPAASQILAALEGERLISSSAEGFVLTNRGWLLMEAVAERLLAFVT